MKKHKVDKIYTLREKIANPKLHKYESNFYCELIDDINDLLPGALTILYQYYEHHFVVDNLFSAHLHGVENKALQWIKHQLEYQHIQVIEDQRDIYIGYRIVL
jgi:hypothetical protein